MKIALVRIAKNEDDYIEEWVNYHLKLGFSKIFIYENNWRCVIENPNVVKIPFDGEVVQVSAYNHFIENNKENFDWVGFIDVDEFLVLKTDNDVNEFLNRFNDYYGVGINWVLFGDNGLERIDKNYSVLERFTKRQIDVNQHIKSFLNFQSKQNFKMGVHNPNLKLVNQEYKEIYGSFCNDCSTHLAQINHYFCKTKEEFIEKVNRGRADTNIKRKLSDFDWHNFNDIEDLTALNFYKK